MGWSVFVRGCLSRWDASLVNSGFPLGSVEFDTEMSRYIVRREIGVMSHNPHAPRTLELLLNECEDTKAATFI